MSGNDNVIPFMAGAVSDNARPTTEKDDGGDELTAILSQLTTFISEHRGELQSILFVATTKNSPEPVVGIGGSFSPAGMAGTLEAIKFDMLLKGMLSRG